MKIVYASEYMDHIEFAQAVELSRVPQVECLILTGTQAFVEELNLETNLEAVFIPNMSKSRFNRDLKRNLIERLTDFKPDLVYTVHGNKITANMVSALKNPKLRHIPLLTYRGVVGNISWFKNPESLVAFNHPRVDGVMGTSKAVKSYLYKQPLIKNKHIGTVFPGVDKEFLKIKSSEEILDINVENDKLNLCVVGYDRPTKGFDFLVEAISMLSKKFKSKIKVYFIGDAGKWETKLKDNSNYVFMGFKKNPWKYFKCFDFLVMPSRQEGLGRAAVEASFLGLPVISSDAGGLPEVVQHNETGLVFKKFDAKDLNKIIRDLLSRDDLDEFRDRLSKNAVSFSQDTFSKERVVRDLYSSFLELIEKKKRSL